MSVSSSCEIIPTKHEIFNCPVQTQNGPVKGIIKSSRDPDQPYVAFMGLRYAEPPERFEIAKKLQAKWTEPKIADKPGNICMQFGLDGQPAGDEDCLFLNIYVPKIHLENGLDKLPVMFWVHGGGFTFGEGHTYGAEFFLENGDIILVTVNYRLGGLGFMSTGDGIIPGNIGLRDLVLALKYVNEEITAFKGNPGNVTLFGESAGGACVHYLLMSPLTRGLIHRAIMQSGAISFWGYDPCPRETAKKLAEHLKCDLPSEPEKESVAIRDCLKKISAVEFGKAHASFNPRWPLSNPMSASLPTAVEPGENAFFSVAPELFIGPGICKTEYPNNIPIIVGVCQTEDIFLAFVLAEQKLPELAKNWNTIAPKAFMFENFFQKTALPDVSQKIKEFYMGKEDNLDLEKKLVQMAEIMTDSLFLLPVMYAGMEMTENGNEVYPYVFSYLGESGVKKMLQLPETISDAVGHADDIQYLFPQPMLGNHVLNSDEEMFSKKMVKLWKSFAKHGKPELDPEWTQATWNPNAVKLADLALDEDLPIEVLEINREPKVVKLQIMRKIKFWKELGEKYGLRT